MRETTNPARVIRVAPLPNEKPAPAGLSWADYVDVRVTTDGGENDADGEDDDGWGVVTSKRPSASTSFFFSFPISLFTYFRFIFLSQHYSFAPQSDSTSRHHQRPHRPLKYHPIPSRKSNDRTHRNAIVKRLPRRLQRRTD